MADVIDTANDHADYLLQLSIAQHQRRAAAPATSAEFCDSCGIDIPEARRVAVPGCQLCIDCQQIREMKRV